jgi:predicted DNA-binding transcriptional regulator YafY
MQENTPDQKRERGTRIKTSIRALRIIEMLLEKEYTSRELEINIFGTDGEKKRTIQGDLDELSAHFGEKFIKVKKGREYHYKLIDLPQPMYNLYTIPPDEIIKIYEFIGLFDNKSLELFETQEPMLVKKIRKELEQVYTLINQPLEDLHPTPHLRTIKKAVRQNRYLSIGYMKEKLIAYNDVKPLKIVFAQNNWYLAVLLQEKNNDQHFTFLRLAFITSVSMQGKFAKTSPVKDALSHLDNAQTLFASMDASPYEVQLLAQRSIARYFREKKYLRSQKIIQENPDGSVLLSYKITNNKEILPLIMRWLPDIYVVSPRKLKTRVSRMLKRYIERSE